MHIRVERDAFVDALGPVQSVVEVKKALPILSHVLLDVLEQYDAKRPARRELYLHLFGENEIDDLLDEMHARYEALIPDIPFIGESNFHLQWFIPNSEKLAEYLVVANYGVSKKEFSTLHLTQASKVCLPWVKTSSLPSARCSSATRRNCS